VFPAPAGDHIAEDAVGTAPLHDVWSAAIVALTAVPPLALTWNLRVHGSRATFLMGALRAVLVPFAFLVAYDWRAEAAGFALLLGAALLNVHLFRRALGC
jgi:hypothetical protein